MIEFIFFSLINVICLLAGLLLLLNAAYYFSPRHPFLGMFSLLFLTASSIAFFASIAAVVANIIIVIFWGFIVIISFKNWSFHAVSSYINSKTLLSFISITVIFLLYVFYSLNYSFVYNGHDPYLFSIPFEIVESDYYSRLKVFDNYPYEWSKYHFFHGSLYSIFIKIVPFKNIFIFKYIQLVCLLLGYLAVSEYKTENIHQIIILILCVIFAPSLSWLASSNGIFSLIALILAIISYIEKKHLYSLFFLAILMCSSSRTILPAGIVFTYIFFRDVYGKEKTPSLFYVILLFPFLTTLSMVFTGDINLEYHSLNEIGQLRLENFQNDWFRFLILIKLGYLLLNLSLNIKISLSLCLTAVLFFNNFILRKKIFSVLLIYFLSILWMPFLLKGLENIINPLLIILTLIVSFWIIYQKQELSKTLKTLIYIYLIVSYTQILIIPPDSSVVNLMIFDVILLLILIHDFVSLPMVKRKFLTSTLYILLPVSLYFYKRIFFPDLRSESTFVYNMKNIDLDKIKVKEKILDYSLHGEQKAILNNCFYGKKINYSLSSTKFKHVSKQFTIVK